MEQNTPWPRGASAALTLTFDDGFADTLAETSHWLSARGIGATYFVLTGSVGKQFEHFRMASWGCWQQAANLNHEIGSHGVTHTPLAGLNSELQRFVVSMQKCPYRFQYLTTIVRRYFALRRYNPGSETIIGDIDPRLTVSISRNDIENHISNCSVLSFSYPAGRMNKAARLYVQSAGYRSARSLDAGINHSDVDAFGLRSVSLGTGFTRIQLRQWMKTTILRSGWLILTFHLVAENNPYQYPYYCSLHDFKGIVHEIEEFPFWVAPQSVVADHLWGNTT